MDVESLCSLRFHAEMREGRYLKVSTAVFDPDRKRFHYEYKTRKSDGSEEKDLPGGCAQDTLSVVYFLRTLGLKEGEEIDVPVHDNGKIFTVKMRVKGSEKIKTPAGRFECFHIEPVLSEHPTKRERKARIEAWLTKDERRIPVRLHSELSFGSIDARMTDYAAPEP
jgi:hypothetical protein